MPAVFFVTHPDVAIDPIGRSMRADVCGTPAGDQAAWR
jgi:hypothetical protein